MSSREPSSSIPTKPSVTWRWFISLLGFMISAISLYLVFRQTDWQNFWGGILNAQLGFIVLRYLSLVATLFIQSLRWRVLSHKRLKAVDGFWLIGIGLLFNNVLPARLGEGIRLLLASRRPTMSLARATATILIERLLDVATLVVLLGILLPIMNLPLWTVTTAMLLGSVAAVGLIFLLVIRRYPTMLSGTAQRILSRMLGTETSARVLTPIVAGVSSIPETKSFLAAIGLSLASWLISGVGAWMLMLALWKEPQPISMGLLATLSAGLGVTVPSAPGGIGPYEAAVVTSLNFLGYDANIGRPYAVMLHLTALTLTSGLGIGGLIREGLSPFSVLRETKIYQGKID